MMSDLTKAQQEFFKDSKARDENGNLLIAYHGSKVGGFNEFRYSPGIQTGQDFGKAFYFTSDAEKAKGYAYDPHKDPRVVEYQKQKEVLKKKFLQTMDEADKQAFLNFKLNGKTLNDMIYGDEIYDTGGEVIAAYLNFKNPLIVDADGQQYNTVYPDYFREAKDDGYDGIIIQNVVDNPRGTPRLMNVYVAFEPEQIKSIDNKYPTQGANFRDNSQEYWDKNQGKLTIQETIALSRHISEQKERMKDKEEKLKEHNGMVAVHNLSLDKLSLVIDRGAFVCPSVAYTTDDNCMANNGYGDVTVVFSEDTIDPAKNKDAILLSGDGYTSDIKNGWRTDTMTNEELIQRMKEQFENNVSFMYSSGDGPCKAAGVQRISLEQAQDEKYRIIPYEDYARYKDKFLDKYEVFLDKNFKGWFDSNIAKKYVFETPFTRENSLIPSVENGVKECVRACAQHSTPAEQFKAIKEACHKYGLKVSASKIEHIRDFTNMCRNSAIVYFEAKIFQAVPVKSVQGIVLPEHSLKYHEGLEDKLKAAGIPYSTYKDVNERKGQILSFAHPELTREQQHNKQRKNNDMER